MLTTALLGLLVFLLSRWFFRRPSGLPPGPTRFPLVGSPHVYLGDLRRNLRDLRTSYGDVSTVYFGETVVVVLNGLDTIRGALKKHALMDRPNTFFRKALCKNQGLGFGCNWKAMRALSIMALKKFGIGRQVIEEKILEETEGVVEEFYKTGGGPFNPETLISNLSFNIVCSVILREKLSAKDDDFMKYMKDMKIVFKAAEAMNLLTPFPWLKWIPGDPFGFYKAETHYNAMIAFQEKHWIQHRQTRTEQYPRDVMDFFIDKQESGRIPYQESDLLSTLHDLVTAATETTASTVLWGIVFLMRHPEVQHELQAEVDRFLGDDGVPNLLMRLRMTKLEAFVLECLRLGDVVPFSLPHAASENTTINGYIILKGTPVITNLHGVLYDPDIWGDPEQFRPWRFLAEDGSIITDLASNVIAFGGGRRACIGESMARMVLFLVSCRLLQRFSFFAPYGSDPFSIEGHLGITHTPKPFTVLVKQRSRF